MLKLSGTMAIRERRFLICSQISHKSHVFVDIRFTLLNYSGVRVIASRILYEICLLIGELAIRRTLIVRLGTKSHLLIEQYCY